MPPSTPRSWPPTQLVLLAVAAVELVHYSVLAVRGDPLNFGSLLSLAAAGACSLWVVAARTGVAARMLSPTVRRALLALTAALGAVLLAAVVWMALGARSDAEHPVDVAVILGAGLKHGRPTPTLHRRIDTAAAWLLAHPGVPVVACGGVGAGQPISEAEAIRDGLVARGVEPGRIRLENRSTTTEENLRFARTLLAALPERPRALVVTSNFHLARSKLIARRAGFEPFGLPASTPWYSLPNSAARETLAIAKTILF